MIHFRYAGSTLLLVGTALAMGLTACGGGASPTPAPSVDSTPGADAGGSKAGDRTGSNAADAGSATPNGTADGGHGQLGGDGVGEGPGQKCKFSVEGIWKGTVEGVVMSIGKAPAKGTVVLDVLPASGLVSALADDSVFDVIVDSPLGPVPFKQALKGTIDCGLLKASLSANVAGTDITGTATCTFDSTGCKGTWMGGSTDMTATANGTFSVTR